MQDWVVARQLNGTPGIAEVNSFGGELKQYEVSVNPNRLKAMGVSIPDILRLLEKTIKIQEVLILTKTKCLFHKRYRLGYLIEDVQNIAVKKTQEVFPFYKRCS